MSDPKTVRICMIAGDKFADGFMHAADMFEPSKRLAHPQFLAVTLSPDHAPLAEIVDRLRQAAAEKWIVVAAFVVGTCIGYVDETVTLVSNGKTFCTLQEMLEECGYVAAATHEDASA